MKRTRSKPVRLYLVRHGETSDNTKMAYVGLRDLPLTDRGKSQARRAAAALAKVPIYLVLSSPMRRAADTAAAIAKACGAEMRTERRLIEGSFGSWEGRTRSEVLALGSRDAELLARWESDPAAAPPGGESIESIQRRVVDLAEDLSRKYSGCSIVAVSHAGPIKALLAAALDIPLQSTQHLFLDPGTISVVEWGEWPLLRLFNSHAHLGWPAARWMND